MILVTLGLLACVSAQTHEISEIYKRYKSRETDNRSIERKKTHIVHLAKEHDALDSPFFPPLPGQTSADYHPQLRKPLEEDEPITYYSWHLHMYYFHEDKNVTDRALALRDEFMTTFNVQNCVDDCFMGGPFDNCSTGTCTWDPFYGVDGPHPYGQWGAYVTNEMLAETISWMTMNHGEHEVLFHPNTGLMVGDHDPNMRALWMKTQVPLDLDFLVWLQCEWFPDTEECPW